MPIKATRYIIETITPSTKTVEITSSPLISDYTDLVDAMEHLVERINELVNLNFLIFLNILIC